MSEDTIDKVLPLFDCGVPKNERDRIDKLVDIKVSEGHSNHCAMRMVVGKSKCICKEEVK